MADPLLRIGAIEPFRSLEPRQLQDIAQELNLVYLKAGEVLFRQGDPGDSMYVLVSGSLIVSMERPDDAAQTLDRLQPGTTVGELALLTGQPRSATVIAEVDSELAQLSGAGFDRLATEHPKAMSRFAQAMVPRIKRAHLAGILAELLGPVSAEVLHEVEARLEWLHLSSGQTLLRQGEPPNGIYIVVTGRLRLVAQQPGGRQQLVGEASRGDIVGEASQLTGQTADATVHAIRDTDVVRLSGALFERLVEQYPRAALQIARKVIERARLAPVSTEERARQPATPAGAFALVALDPGLPLAKLAQRLADALARYGPTLHLSSRLLDSRLGKEEIAQLPPDHPAGITLANWLSEQESRHRYIVYQGDARWSAWTARCVRQADRVLLVGRSNGEPQLQQADLEIQRAGVRAHQELVLVHPDNAAQPSGTRYWLHRRQVVTHHHVRLGRAGDVERLARRLAGCTLSLVLGGGGARGYAHIGAIRALEEAGIEIDMMGGTSMGSLVAGTYAARLNWLDLLKTSKRFGSPRELFDYTLPVVSFFASKKLTRMLRLIFGDLRIEDLWRPFFCVSSNFTRAEPHLHLRGPVWSAVRASLALPGIFAPMLHKGELLADGGALNNLPVDVMRELAGRGPIIAISVSPERAVSAQYSFGPYISGWRALWARVNPLAGGPQAPLIFESLLRNREVNEVYQRRQKVAMADLFLTPPVGQFSILDFRPVEPIMEAGYRYAKPLIEEWLKSSDYCAKRRALGRHQSGANIANIEPTY